MVNVSFFGANFVILELWCSLFCKVSASGLVCTHVCGFGCMVVLWTVRKGGVDGDGESVGCVKHWWQ